MLASPTGVLPSLRGWTIEPKWDGYRVLAEVSAKGVHLWSRNGNDKAKQFPDVTAALQKLGITVILDGELIALDPKGKALRFQELQQGARSGFAVFDILLVERRNLMAEPWTTRRKELSKIISSSTRSLIRLSPSHACGSAGAKKLIDAAHAEGWEGLILKQMDSPYTPGKRSPQWRKVKLEHEQEFVIGGYTLPTEGAARDHFGALLVGHYDKAGNLRYAGKVGTGYSHATLAKLGKQLASLKRATSPFSDTPRNREKSIWVKPTLVAQIRYNEMTKGGMLRQPAFLGLRDDKKARDVHLDAEASRQQVADALRCAS